MRTAENQSNEPLQAEVNIGMVGHVDHGKTSLTKAITGKWTDTHSEELKRGISIRLGYADAVFYKCEKCSGAGAYATKPKCGKCSGNAKLLRKVSFVDAPGHETLMTTMLSGAALMNGAILVIAANEPCPQPRTAEHLTALKMSGINSIVVAQNKIDLVSREKALESFREIREFLKEYDAEDAQIIPVAAHFNANIDALVEALEKAIPSPKFESGKPLRMFIARSFDINRPGSKAEELKGGALGGSITLGFAKVGDEIEIAPGIDGKKLKTKISSLSTANYELKEAKPGGLIAIGTTLDPSITKNDQMRGQVVGALNTLPEPVSRVKLEVHEMKRLLEEIGKIKVNETVVLTVGTASIAASVAKMAGSNKFEFLLKSPVVVEPKQKVAISKLVKSAWRLAAYGVVS
ncbi:MAG: translation initiation factor IF-2 subunit gamma [Candidatus Diapherotrites archaeon]|nr:translation initiation factor IF-2 subunit gamma [Candidatus Diapherotrites archaeon]